MESRLTNDGWVRNGRILTPSFPWPLHRFFTTFKVNFHAWFQFSLSWPRSRQARNLWPCVIHRPLRLKGCDHMAEMRHVRRCQSTDKNTGLSSDSGNPRLHLCFYLSICLQITADSNAVGLKHSTFLMDSRAMLIILSAARHCHCLFF